MKKVILMIEGMSCSGCSNGLEKYLNKQDGVESASVNLVLKTATITYTDKIDISDIEKYIKDAGFKSLGEEKLLTKKEKNSVLSLVVFGIIALIIMYITMEHHLNLSGAISIDKTPKMYSILLIILTVPFLIYSLDILKRGIKSLIHFMPSMDTLITLGIISSYSYSIFSTIMLFLGNKEYIDNIYFESTIFLIYFAKFGRFIVDRSKDKTEQDIKDLVRITPSKAHLKTDDDYVDITIDEVKKGDILICLPGEKISVDGEVIEGSTTIDESLITGESKPVQKMVKSKVIAGSINYDGKK